jgi:hypothetical protein
VEYGVTEQFATELMLESFEEVSTGISKFTGFRWENRYRLFREETPLNPTIYTEYEDLHPATRFKMEVSGWVHPPYEEEEATEPHRERIMESRLILSQDFGPWNTAFNWLNESDLNADGFTAFGYMLGVRYAFGGGHHHHGDGNSSEPDRASCADKGLRPTLGLEWYGALGDTRRMDFDPARQEHYLQPVLMLHLSENVMFHLGIAIGLSAASDDMVRTGVAIEF